MNDIGLDQQDQQLRREADDLLARHSILPILRGYGRPHLSGSYDLHLMTWRDLDIYLEMDPPDLERFLQLGYDLGRALKPRKLSFTNHQDFPATEAVAGLYWGIHTDILSRGGWKIDLWGVTPEACAERLAYCESLRAAIDAVSRRSILTIKNAVCRLPGYRDTITSQNVYDAVLRGGAATVDDFWRYVRSAKAHG